MNTRLRDGALLCLLLLLAPMCRAELRSMDFSTPSPHDLPFNTPAASPGDADTGNPQWLKDELARREALSRERNRMRQVNPTKPVENPKKDLGGSGQLDRPLETRRTDTRLMTYTPETPPPLRATVRAKGERMPAPNPYADIAERSVNAEAVDLSGLSPNSAARENLADSVDLPRGAPARARDSISVGNVGTAGTVGTIGSGVGGNAAGVSGDVSDMRPAQILRDSRAANNPDDSVQRAAPRDTLRDTIRDTPRDTVRDTVPAVARGDLAETVDVIRVLSRIEKLYNSTDGLSRRKNLEQFGYKAFAGGSRPDANATIDPEFVLGSGDEIHVKSVDGFEYDKTLTVERDGTIFIEQGVGSVRVAGLKAGDLAAAIQGAVAQTKKNFKLDVSLGKLHSIRVMVAGVVKYPGLQNLSANSTLMDALVAVGGPTKDGTLRDVIVQRPGKDDLHVDLYNLLASGGRAEDVVLLSGDRIFVGPIGQTAGVIGPAGSGIYEFAGRTVLESLMKFAGRINGFTQLNNVQVERTYDNARRNVRLLDYRTEAATFTLQDGDVIAFTQISGQLNETVAVNGAVVRPGAYPLRGGMKVSDLIKGAGGFLLDANLDRALLIRPLGDQAAFDNMIGDKAGRTREETIWIDLAGIMADNKDADIALKRLDSLKIFTQNEVQDTPTVKIIGGIRKPGTYRLTAGLTLGDLIRVAGGPTSDAFAGESTIVRRKRAPGDMHLDVEIISFRLDNVQRRISDYDEPLENQDQIVIKRVTSMQAAVRIYGRIQFPGTHVLPDGAKISDLLAAAGGLLPDADLRAAVFTRRRIQQLQQARLDDLFTRMEEVFGTKRNDVIKAGHNNEGIAAHLSYLGLGALTNNIERFQARGRLVINMTCPNFFTTHDNVVLEEGDELYIPRRENIVIVLGEMNYPNAIVWNPELTVGDYLNKAGGLLPEADKKQIYVVMANGEVYSGSNKNLFGGNVTSFRPGPGDSILVPKKPPSRSNLATASDVALLIRQFAEVGLVGATIPQALSPMHPANVNLGVGNSNQSPPDIINNNSSEQFYSDQRNLENRPR